MVGELRAVYDLWREFEKRVTRKTRFFPSDPFLEELEKLLSEYKYIVPADQAFYRARIYKWENNERHFMGQLIYRAEEMGAPPPDKTKEGRANPKGIPVLYVADDVYTAIAEVRPWRSSEVCVAKCITKKQCKVLDVASRGVHPIMTLLGIMFSQPVASHSEMDYLPTQVISEFVRNKGFDGIKYLSMVGTGFNTVFFDTNIVSISDNVMKFTVDGISYAYNPAPTEGENFVATAIDNMFNFG